MFGEKTVRRDVQDYKCHNGRLVNRQTQTGSCWSVILLARAAAELNIAPHTGVLALHVYYGHHILNAIN